MLALRYKGIAIHRDQFGDYHMPAFPGAYFGNLQAVLDWIDAR